MNVGIVNDQQFATEVLRRIVHAHPLHLVVWTAGDGDEALRCCRKSVPDVILMDLIMPGMTGAETTRRIMQSTPCPILVVTSTLTKNFSLVCEALGFGAFDAVQTPVLGAQTPLQAGAELLQKLEKVERVQRRLSGTDSGSSSAWVRKAVAEPPPATAELPARLPPIVAIGASTGGPPALQTILSALPGDLPAAVIVAQHIGAEFVAPLVEWLSASTRLKLRAAHAGDRLERGVVLVASTADHIVVSPDGTVRYTSDPLDNPFRPSVDILFGSLALCRNAFGVAVLLTGIGKDGAKGLLKLRQGGWNTIAQDKATCVVYGMPQAAAEINAAMSVLPLPDIAQAITRHIQRPSVSSVS